MTLEELGKRISVSKQTVQRYESGQIPNIPYDKIELLAKVFGCSRPYLMGWEDNLNKENSDLIPDILSDNDLINHIKKLMCLNELLKKRQGKCSLPFSVFMVIRLLVAIA